MRCCARLAVVALLLLGAVTARAEAARPLVVSSIRPLHLILLALAGETVEARVLLDAGASPHDFALRPSQLRLLTDARQLFWLGPQLEYPLVAMLERLEPARDTALLGLLDVPPRADGTVDPHLWLDPRLAAATAAAMTRALGQHGLAAPQELAPRLLAFESAMRRTEDTIAAELAGLEQVPFAAMHDGYSHFVRRFGLRQVAVLALDAEQQVGARALSRLRRTVRDSAAVCLLAERAGGNARLAQAIAEGSGMRVAELDSLAADTPEASGAYAQFLTGFAQALAACLRGPAQESATGKHDER